MIAGHYEDNQISPSGPIFENGSGWSTATNRRFSNGSLRQTINGDPDFNNPANTGDFIQFRFVGTGFDIGTQLGPNGSEMRVCWQQASTFDGSFFDNTGEPCLDFQNEDSRTSYDVLRSVTGLPYGVYTVGVLHGDDGLSISGAARSSNYPATMMIDFIDIFNESALQPLTDPGIYNEDALASNDKPFLQLMPSDRWTQVSGRSARNATGESYYGVIDSRGRITRSNAGAAAAIQVTVAANSEATLALDTYATGSGHSNQLQACILNGLDLVSCSIIPDMADSHNQVVHIDNTGGAETDYTVMFQVLTPGYFRIDGYQLIQGDTLTEGIYDDHFMYGGGLINLTGTWMLSPEQISKYRGAYGDTVAVTQELNADAVFKFQGTGFSIINVEDADRLQLEICYVTVTQFGIDGFNSATCETRDPELTRGRYPQYGLTVMGLKPDTYEARVRVSKSPTDLKSQYFRFDALVIFGDVTAGTALAPGLYDDAQLLGNAAVRFAPAPFWSANSRVRSGPPAGPWQLTEQLASNVGSVLQLYLEGNVLTLYQNFGVNSRNIRVCQVIPGNDFNELQCGNFSQSGKRYYFTPISFFGLGDGEHELIFENREPRRNFNVDAVQVTP